VERYKSIEQDIDLVEDLINMGAYIQVNANSIIGKSGGRSKKFTRNLLQRDMVHFIGTDSHNMNSRSPSIKKCVNHINKRYGTTYLEKWLVDNPRKILNKEYI
jgi:protein-tyrosine phosphatase